MVCRDFVNKGDGRLARFIVDDIIEVFGKALKIMLCQEAVEPSRHKSHFFRF
jgi:hypothetical protein